MPEEEIKEVVVFYGYANVSMVSQGMHTPLMTEQDLAMMQLLATQAVEETLNNKTAPVTNEQDGGNSR